MSDFETAILNPPTKPSLACVDCGMAVAVDSMTPVETLIAHARMRLMNPMDSNSPVIAEERAAEFTMSICNDCRMRRARAAALLDSHPSVLPQFPQRDTRLAYADAALIVLDALGLSWSRILDHGSEKEVHLFLEKLPQAGAAVRWASRFAPVVALGMKDGQIASARERWAGVSDEQMQMLRDAYAGFLRALTDAPRPVPPPAGDGLNEALRGCLLCGVGTVAVLGSQTRAAWGDLQSAVAATLGGRGRPNPIHGYLCPTCARATEKAGGALGPSAMERALFDFLEVQPTPFMGPTDYGIELPQLVGLEAWGVLPEGTEPNATPWAHVHYLEEVRDELRKL